MTSNEPHPSIPTSTDDIWAGSRLNYEKRHAFEMCCKNLPPRCDTCFWGEVVHDDDICHCHRFPKTGISDTVARWAFCGEYSPQIGSLAQTAHGCVISAVASGRFDVPKRSAIEDCRRMT